MFGGGMPLVTLSEHIRQSRYLRDGARFDETSPSTDCPRFPETSQRQTRTTVNRTLPFQANAAWLITATITHNLTRAVAAKIGGAMAGTREMTLRTRLISILARLAHRSRGLILHLPTG